MRRKAPRSYAARTAAYVVLGAQAEREEGVVALLALHAREQAHRVVVGQRRGAEPLGGKTLAQGAAAVHGPMVSERTDTGSPNRAQTSGRAAVPSGRCRRGRPCLPGGAGVVSSKV